MRLEHHLGTSCADPRIPDCKARVRMLPGKRAALNLKTPSPKPCRTPRLPITPSPRSPNLELLPGAPSSSSRPLDDRTLDPELQT